MTITALPPAPDPTAPSTFNARAAAWVAALNGFVAEMNAEVAALNALALATGPGLFLPGSAAAPGISFAVDPDTGMFRAAGNQLAFATAGVQRLLMGTTQIVLDLPMTGTAVMQSAHDATPGRLAAVQTTGGVFGWGASGVNAVLADLDTLTAVSGLHSTTAATLGTFPLGSASVGMVLMLRYSTTAFAQIFVYPLSGRHFHRNYSSGSFSAWREVINTGNIVGTVSQVGGVPTGPVLETGGNANGRYERRADGVMECWHTLTASASAGVTWTFPSAFIEPPVLGDTAVAMVASTPVLDAAPTATAAILSTRDKTDARRADVMHLRATGRWSTMT